MVESEIKYVVTGSAGFIGFHICHNLLNEGNRVIELIIYLITTTHRLKNQEMKF